MTLTPGTALGPYQVTALLGAGGMGAVYAATDLRLGRAVALKVLPPELSQDPDRRARFEREARVVGALSHPNIVAIHDIGTSGDLTFLVMELLEGETLRARLSRGRGGLPLRKALDIAGQVAQALAAAHARGIVHRDLKPENVFLTTDGQVKVLDFGLARSIAVPPPEAETRTTPAGAVRTDPGTVLGTVGYMAPEQVRGRDADSRADIFALGAVLYEMLTGVRAFAADSPIETMSAILNSDPLERRERVAGLPATVEHLVRHCLEKQPDERFQSARDLAFQLQTLGSETGSGAVAPEARRVPRLRTAAIAVLAAAAVGVTAFLLGWSAHSTPDVFDVGLPDRAPVALVDATPWATEHPALAVAGSGEFFVYEARRDAGTELWYRSLATDEARPLPGTARAVRPFLSPDNDWVGFFADGALKKVAVDGSAPATAIAEVSESWGAVWLDENRILVSPNFGKRLEMVTVSLGSTRVVQDAACREPDARIDGGRVVVVCVTGDQPQHISRVVSLVGNGSAGTAVPVTREADGGRGVAGGEPRLLGDLLAWVTYGGDLAAAHFDPATGVVGPSVVVRRQLHRSRIWSSAHFGVTDAGDLIYVPGSNAGVGRFIVADPTAGSPVVLPIEPKQFLGFAPSPDGTRIAATSIGVGDSIELWLYDVASGNGERIASGADISWPAWSPDGRLIVTLTEEGKGSRMVAVNPSRGNTLAEFDGPRLSGLNFVSATWAVGTVSGDVVVQNMKDASRLYRLRLPDSQYYPVVSSDRRWLAYSGVVQGTSNVYVTPFPTLEYQLQVSVDGGGEPVFLPDGSLLFRQGTSWWRAPRRSSGQPFGTPEPYWSDENLMNTAGLSNAVMPDGSLLYLRSVAPATAGYVRVVRNWLGKARALVR